MLQKIKALFIGLGKKVKETFNKEIIITKVEEAKVAVNASVHEGMTTTSKWVDETKAKVEETVADAKVKMEEVASDVKVKVEETVADAKVKADEVAAGAKTIMTNIAEQTEKITNECKNICSGSKEVVTTEKCIIDEVAGDMHSQNVSGGTSEVLTEEEVKKRMTEMSDNIIEDMKEKSKDYITGKFTQKELDIIEGYFKFNVRTGGVVKKEHVDYLAKQLSRAPRSIKTKLNQLMEAALKFKK